MSDDDGFGPAGAAPGPARRAGADRLGVVLGLGAVLLVGGTVAAVVLARRGVASFGWFAYAPLTQEVFSPAAIVLQPGVGSSIAVAVVGLVLVSGAVGYRLGGRGGQQR